MTLAKNPNNEANGGLKKLLAAKMADRVLLDLQERALLLNKMLRYQYNISEEVKADIKAETRPELIPLAEE